MFGFIWSSSFDLTRWIDGFEIFQHFFLYAQKTSSKIPCFCPSFCNLKEMLPIWFRIFFWSSLVALASLSSGRCQAPPATRSLNQKKRILFGLSTLKLQYNNLYLFVFCLYLVPKLFRDDIDIDLSFEQAVSAVEVGPVSPKMWDIRFAAAERSLTETFRLGFVVASIVVQNRK